MNPSDELNQPTKTHETVHLIEALGAVVLFALIGWLAYSYLPRVPGSTPSGAGTEITKEAKQELLKEMSARASTTVTVSASEKERLIGQMLQPASSTVQPPGTSQAARTPVVTADEKQKLIDAMQQKAR